MKITIDFEDGAVREYKLGAEEITKVFSGSILHIETRHPDFEERFKAGVIKELLLEIDNIPTKEAGHNKDVEHYQREVVRLQGKILDFMSDKTNSYPIDTAPKTGERIIVSDGPHTICAYWDYEDWCAPYSGANSIGFTPDRWCRMPDLSKNDDLVAKNTGL